MTKLERVNELIDELNELKLPYMASSLDVMYHSKSFDELDAISLLEEVIDSEYQSKTSQRLQNRLKRARWSAIIGSLQRLI